MKLDFTGKAYLVIGGARGIGAAVCRQIGRSGAKVAWTHLDNEADREGTKELQAEFQGLDIKQQGCVTLVFQRAERLSRRLRPTYFGHILWR